MCAFHPASQVHVPSTPSMLLSFIVIFMFCIVKRTKINKIEPEFGPLPKLLPQLYVDYVVNTDPSFDIKISITGQNLTQWRTRRWDRLNCLRSTHDSHSFDVQSSNQSVNSRIFFEIQISTMTASSSSTSTLRVALAFVLATLSVTSSLSLGQKEVASGAGFSALKFPTKLFRVGEHLINFHCFC